MHCRIRKAEDFSDARAILPRFSNENIEKNVGAGDKFKELGKKYKATGAQIILAWILAEHSDCIVFFYILFSFPLLRNLTFPLTQSSQSQAAAVEHAYKKTPLPLILNWRKKMFRRYG